MNTLQSAVEHIKSDLISFAQDLVRIKSYSGNEKAIINFIKQKMTGLKFDEVIIDSMGNLLGRIGNGKKVILFDSHIDTVEVNDSKEWNHDPFGGIIDQGRLYGRGSVDMKSSAAASIYAAVLAKRLNSINDKTIYVSCTVLEEDCDGENLKHLFKETGIRPDDVVICEPSDNKLVTGHKGKAQVAITTHGVSAHGSAPEKGENAIYEMAGIIQRINRLSQTLASGKDKTGEKKGTLVASDISSISESLNAVPFECNIYLDRRMVLGETKDTLVKEMNAIIEDKNASWRIGTLHRKSWTGKNVTYQPFHPAWEIETNHRLTKTCVEAYKQTFTLEPEFDYWDFSTNAVTTTAMEIPTIGFGPGEYKLAHMRNEHCKVSQIIDACQFYTNLINLY